MNTLSVFKCNVDATLPTYATTHSACFDLYACLISGSTVRAYKSSYFQLGHIEEQVLLPVEDGNLVVPPTCRVLIPTGIKFRIPVKCSVRLHPRSGISIKNGLTLINCEGVIDEDYFDEVFAPLHNISSTPQVISHGMRVCQGELVADSRATIIESNIEPTQRTNRVGGFGSTGK